MEACSGGLAHHDSNNGHNLFLPAWAYHDEGCECYVLEVWPVAFEEPEREGSNGKDTDDAICYEFAEFEFGETINLVSLEHLHFSQRREIFEIGWKEEGQDLELRVHLVPQEIDEI